MIPCRQNRTHTMKIAINTKTTLVFATLLCSSSLSFAVDDNKHFASLDSPTIQIAKCNLQAYNEKLDLITNKADITTLDMVKVHELTYTLEVALQRLSKELVVAAEELEKVHKASESMSDEVVKEAAKKYSKLANALTAPTSC